MVPVWSELQMICLQSRWCHCHSIISYFIKIQNGYLSGAGLLGLLSWKRGHYTHTQHNRFTAGLEYGH